MLDFFVGWVTASLSETPGTVHLDHVSDDICLSIFRALRVQSLGNFSCTSHRYKLLIENEVFGMPCIPLAKSFFQTMNALPNACWTGDIPHFIDGKYFGKINHDKSITLFKLAPTSYSFSGRRELQKLSEQPILIGYMTHYKVQKIALTEFHADVSHKEKRSLLIALEVLNARYA